MPDSVITKVESFARRGVVPGAFDFTDRSGILFEWNDEIDESPEGLVAEDAVLYSSIVAEFPGVTLDRDIAVATVESDVEPHGRLEDAAAHNAGLELFDIAGVNRAAIIDTLEDELVPDDDGPDDDGIIAVADVPPAAGAPAEALLVDNDDEPQDGGDAYDDVSTDNEDTDNDEEEDNDDLDDDDDANGGDGTREANDAAAIAAGLRRSGRANKGRTKRFANYTLLLHARKVARGGPKWAMIRDGVMMFSANDVSDAKPIPVEDRLEYAFVVILQHNPLGRV